MFHVILIITRMLSLMMLANEEENPSPHHPTLINTTIQLNNNSNTITIQALYRITVSEG